MRPGTQFIFECEGDDATGCVPGDVCVILKLEPHERFLCSGSDLATDYTMTLADVLTGTPIGPIHTVTGGCPCGCDAAHQCVWQLLTRLCCRSKAPVAHSYGSNYHAGNDPEGISLSRVQRACARERETLILVAVRTG